MEEVELSNLGFDYVKDTKNGGRCGGNAGGRLQ